MRKSALAIMLALVVALGLTACGSDSDDSTGGSTSTAETTNESTDAGGGGALSTAEAEAVLKEAETRPTSMNPDGIPPIGKPVPKDKTLAYISCGVPSCTESGEVLKEAAALLGWKTKIYNTDGTPGTIQAAWASAIREEPFGISYGATETSVIRKYLLEAESKGIEVAAILATEPDGSAAEGEGIGFNTGAGGEEPLNRAFSAFVTAKTNAEGKAAFGTIPGFPSFEAQKEETEAQLATMCPECSLDTIEVPLEELGSAPTLIVAYLRANPDVKTLVLSAAELLGTGLPAALKAAGINDVQITGSTAGDPSVLQYVEEGAFDSTNWAPLWEYSYECVDYFARVAAGADPIPPNPPLIWLLTKGQIPSLSGKFPIVENVEEEYATAWGLK